MDRVYLLYKTDFNHSNNSKELITVCGDMQTINEIIVKHAEENDQKITDECLIQIQSIGQTQIDTVIERDFEYLVELSPFDSL